MTNRLLEIVAGEQGRCAEALNSEITPEFASEYLTVLNEVTSKTFGWSKEVNPMSENEFERFKEQILTSIDFFFENLALWCANRIEYRDPITRFGNSLSDLLDNPFFYQYNSTFGSSILIILIAKECVSELINGGIADIFIKYKALIDHTTSISETTSMGHLSTTYSQRCGYLINSIRSI